ncbi:hypothetical protein NDU88_002261 [Pleurodeles waltl]|uniref:Uncharacterized protein n=1 Tax=Pleurodeles waltl TaxID=8319 RepID=A0AAV7LDB2_PLEWA|nr:hypothetical protein NDU88_002261 [Pleurodeles waltl]
MARHARTGWEQADPEPQLGRRAGGENPTVEHTDAWAWLEGWRTAGKSQRRTGSRRQSQRGEDKGPKDGSWEGQNFTPNEEERIDPAQWTTTK